jgi:3-deoxy-7-phosphoheptulonate synthase
VLVQGAKKPVTRIGRFAGQYAKPRSQPTETRVVDGEERSLPSYFGDLVNRAEFEEKARALDPYLLLEGYKHAALTLNFIRSLTKSGFVDFHHPEYWDLSFVESAHLPGELRTTYQRIVRELRESLAFMQALGERPVTDLTRVDFYTSHEGLNLHYEAAQTRRVPRREGWYCLTTHLPWIGERTRDPNGAHVQFFRGVENPVGIKIGPSTSVDDLHALLDVLNPDNAPGKIVLITRMGATRAKAALPPLYRATKSEGRRVLWVCDPMHGNTHSTSDGRKTRSFDAVLSEVETTIDVHSAEGTIFGGVHFELTGEDVTECIGGAEGLTEADLSANYATACDPRLNYRQALEMAIRMSDRLARLA